MLSEEQAESSRFFCELAPAKFGWRIGWVERVQAFHVKGVQGVKTGTGGHLPCDKVPGKIAEVRGLEPGQAAISPSTFTDLQSVADFRNPADDESAKGTSGADADAHPEAVRHFAGRDDAGNRLAGKRDIQ